MSMKQIETLVFDYGGAIVNIDDASVVKAIRHAWGKQHFKIAGLSLAPFGKDVELGF